ncbi:extracellular solute-binding protein [Sideroxydans sp. CL21]|uniref:ABC transporter substrate-binding protein n=1 Tax=Sideroxydans sp. CL21 TaxID=2600596 RepID=UPI0012A9F460|nr:extracellular solute-binding protein [Sideroxydans sp. CL21]VVC84714.1 Ferric iron ABC transporter, iron-binding protein [Sideroxydans sp. CL21]
MTQIKWILTACLLLMSQLASATEKVVVLSSYPQEVITQFEAAFEQAYPQYRLEILWRQSRDAMTYLHQPHSAVDVYWTPAQRNFAVLAKEGAFRKLDIDLGGLPKKIGGFQISDPDGYYVASETAGYGMAYHPAELQRLGLPVPTDWKSLAAPAYSGHVVLPIPSKVGYAPMLVDTLLQGYGWEQGWSVLEQVAANASLADAGATFISDDVGSGRIAVGMTMDFFAVSAIANGKPLRFTYPEKVGYSPAHVAIFRDAANPEGARAFVSFVLSEQGQKLLFHPDIRKLPVRPAVYAAKPDGYFDPFAAAQRASYDYDLATGLKRQELVGALFDALITHHHTELKAMWTAIHQAEQKSPGDPRLQEAKQKASWLPLTAAQSNDAVLQQTFIKHDSHSETLEQEWDAEIAEHYAQATQIALSISGARP